MYEDEPSDKVHDVLARAVFGDHPLGRPVIGRAEVISSVPVPDIARYHDHRYNSDNLVLAAAGNIDHDRLVELAVGSPGRAPRAGRTGSVDAPPAARGAAALPPEGHRAVPPVRRRARPLARRRAALRAARAGHDPRRLDVVAAVPGDPREARPRLRGLLVPEPLRGLRPDRDLRRDAARERAARRSRSSAASSTGSGRSR